MIQINENVDFPGGLSVATGSIVESFARTIERVSKGLTSDAIVGVNTGTKTFERAGDKAEKFKDGASITVIGSTGNNGTYTINGDATYNGGSGKTEIIVTESIPDATADGSIEYIDIQWVLIGVTKWWKSLTYCNANVSNTDEVLDEPAVVKELTKTFNITEAESNQGLATIFDNKYKAILDGVYTPSNVVIS